MKKILIILLLSFLILGMFTSMVMAESVMDKVRDNSEKTDVVKEADYAMASVLEVARGIGVVGLVGFIAWAAFVMFFAPEGEKIRKAKGQVAGVLFFVFFLYKTETIVRTVFKLFGIEV